ncbi:MAG: CPBP family intramembrane glutamic endopeptidase [Bacteroidales bacterium]|jgi:membrane protease YdiL (CAAX protease family)|nr:CPBP family intramembrane glutamic endopeptidase [Bacteroidales bacterium]
MKNSFASLHPFSKFIFSLFIILASFLIVFVLGLAVGIPIFNLSFAEIPEAISNYTDPHHLKFLKYLQSIQALGLFILPAFIIGYLFHQKSFRYLKFNALSLYAVLLIPLIMVSALPTINFFALINSKMQLPSFLSEVENWMRQKESGAQALTEAFLTMDSIGGLLFNIFMIGILPAVGEELIFRGVIQRIFTEWTKNIHWGIFIAAFLFSFMHIQFYGFIPRMVLGMILGYLFYISGSIWAPILGHFVNNTMAVIFYYFFAGQVSEEIDTLGATEGSYGYLLVSVILILSFFYLFYQHHPKSIRH